MKSPRRFSTEELPFVPQKVFLWAHSFALRKRSIARRFLYLLLKSMFLGLFSSDTEAPGPTGEIFLNGNRLMIDFESSDKNRSTIDDFEGPRNEPKGRLFEVQKKTFMWKTALETSFHELQMVRSPMRDCCFAQQTVSLKNCADRLPTCGVKTRKWQEVP